MVSNIRKQLEKATKISIIKGEDYRKYLSRLADGVSKISDAKWDSLTEEAQVWVNNTIDLLDEDKPVLDFPDNVEEKVEDKIKTSKKGKGEKDISKVKEIIVDTPKVGGSARILQLVAENPDADIKTISKMLTNESYNINTSTISVRYAIAQQVLKHLRKIGSLK